MPDDDIISPDTVIASLDSIWTTLLDVGADPFLTSKREDVERHYRAARNSITAPMTLNKAWLTVAPVLGSLNDGHVGLGFPEPLNAAPRHFPLRFRLSAADDLSVLSDRTQMIPIGSRIVSIDGISADAYKDATLAAFGGQTVALHRTRVSMSGAWTAIALFGDRPSYVVRYLDALGTAHEATVVTAAIGGAANASARSTSSLDEPYTYSTIEEGRVGYLDYRSCVDLKRFKAFLSATFTTIKATPIDALIIDVRKNGGGDSALNDALWTYVTTKPFKQFGGVVVKSSDRLKKEYGHAKYAEIYGEQAWSAPNGSILRSGVDPTIDLIRPNDLAERYNGPVYLLISPQTFSSAMTCALAAKDYSLATIVGEETGEPVTSTGEVYEEVTPSGLVAYLTTKVFLPPKPHAAREGVVPDIIVPTTADDLAAHRDPVLSRVVSLIRAAS